MPTKLILRAWIEAIIHHALTRLPLGEQKLFILEQLERLEHDFGVRISLDDEFVVEIDYLTSSCTCS